jgi:hypothetical protein
VRTKHFIFQAIVNWKTQNNKLCPCIIDVRLQEEMLVQGGFHPDYSLHTAENYILFERNTEILVKNLEQNQTGPINT